MKSKLSNTFSLLRLFIIAVLAVLCSSCDKTETTDSTGFILYYLGVTDIGPSMSYTLKAPAYKGSTPYDFTITKITLNEETFSNEDNFVINAETGEITIQNTNAMTSGMYSISVGCYSNGKFFDFKDVVQVNMLLAVPEGVTVEPAVVLVNQDEDNWWEASAQITTDADKHVSITGYAIVQDESKPYLSYFDINNDGKITIKADAKDKLVAGENYILSFKLTTLAGNHMYADAVTFKVVSKPRSLIYPQNEDLTEFNMAYESKIPTVIGATEGLKFSIKSITPETTAFSIDEATGKISLPADNQLPVSDTPYVFNITVSNIYGSNNFDAVYSVQVVAFIEEINPTKFYYNDINPLYQQGGSVDSYLPADFEGGIPTFKFDESNSDEIKEQITQGYISINEKNGAISISKEHTLSVKEHSIQVRVSNRKNEEGIVKPLKVNVIANPNNFTYVSWGTNVEKIINDGYTVREIKGDFAVIQEQEKQYRNVIRYPNRGSIPSFSLGVLGSDIPIGSNITYDISNEKFPVATKFKTASISSDGTISIVSASDAFGSSYDGGVLTVKVTVSGNAAGAPAVTKKIPIFFTTPKNLTSNPDYRGLLFLDPSVIRVNPHKGGKYSFKAHLVSYGNGAIKSLYDIDKLILDYRANFSYLNLGNNATHNSGTIDEGGFLSQVWKSCGFSSTNNAPISYINTSISKENKVAYINLENKTYDTNSKTLTGEIVINPDKWKGEDGKYANGVFLGEIRYQINGQTDKIDDTSEKAPLGIAGSSYPLYIWFDESFE